MGAVGGRHRMIAEGRLFDWVGGPDPALREKFERHVAGTAFPCVGAKAALARGTLRILTARALDSSWDDLRLQDALMIFAAEYRRHPALFQSLAVVFEGPVELSEEGFETAMWKRLQSISDKDAWRGLPYDGRVSPDAEDPHFSLSFGGEAFFVVGLHPNASRPARRLAHPTLVFNLHDQFERLRAADRYEGMREKILVRDESLAGSRNPMLARHGSSSEARQYSGRVVGDDWRCPFRFGGS